MQSSVNITNLVDVYEYHWPTLIISYMSALLVALIAVILGLIAFTCNKVKADWSFSFLASVMQHTPLVDDRARRGSAPVPNEAREKRLVFRELGDGGWGFVHVEKIENGEWELQELQGLQEQRSSQEDQE